MPNIAGARTTLAVFALLAASAPAFAQMGGANSPDTAVVPVTGVAVTGARVPETVLQTPAALSVVPRERIVPTRQISLADGLAGIPGVFSQSRSGAQDVRITIRGYGARGSGERSNTGNMRGIRVLTDGVPISEPDGRTSLEFVDLGGTDRIEVLRSNGSVLYGNASGGVVHLRSDLDFDSPWTEWSARGGDFGFHREQGVAGFTLGQGRGLVSVYNSRFEGWRQHSGAATTSVQTRMATPLDDATRVGVLLGFVTSLNRFPGALTRAQLDAGPRVADPDFITRDDRRFNRVGRVALTLDRDLHGTQAFSVASWVEPKVLQRSERGAFRDFTRYHVGGSAVWRITTPIGERAEATWTAGGDEQYQDGTIQFFSLGPGGTRGTTMSQNKREGANSAGGFLQGELRWNDRWGIRLAGRYDNLWYIAENRIDPTVNGTKRFTHVTPKGSIARYFERHTVYASIGGGVEAPAFNEIDPPPGFTGSFNPFLEPMRSTSYEVGGKGELASSAGGTARLAYDAALYWIDVKNEIVPFNNGGYFFTAGESRRRGGELGLDWTPVSPITLRSALTVSNNEYIKYVSTGDFGGHDIPGLPEVVVDGTLRWRPVRGLSLEGTIQHVGKYFADDANTAETDAYELFGAETEYAVPTPIGLLRAFVGAENLTDERYVASVFINGTGGEFFEPGLPRNVYGGLSIALR